MVPDSNLKLLSNKCEKLFPKFIEASIKTLPHQINKISVKLTIKVTTKLIINSKIANQARQSHHTVNQNYLRVFFPQHSEYFPLSRSSHIIFTTV